MFGARCSPASQVYRASPDVFINGLPVHRVTDGWETHTDGSDAHSAETVEGVHGFTVNGKQVAMTGCVVSCGSMTAQGSDNVFVWHSSTYADSLIKEDTPYCSIVRIPKTVHELGWHRAATLMEKWFTGPSNNEKAKGIPDTTTITWEWLLGFDLVSQAVSTLVSMDYLTTDNAKAELIKQLGQQGKLTDKKESFGDLEIDAGDIAGTVNRLHGDHYQSIEIDPYYDYGIAGRDFDEFIAALGTVRFYATAQGNVEPLGDDYIVRIERVAVFIRDHYDFKVAVDYPNWDPRDWNWGNYKNHLGFWNFEDTEVALTPGVDIVDWCHIENETFQEWRDANSHGMDYYVYVTPKIYDDLAVQFVSPPPA